MKRKFIFIVLVLLFPVIAFALPHTNCYWLEWDANTETDLAGYKFYWSTSPNVETFEDANSIDAGNVLTYSLDLVPIGSYIRLTAYDYSGNESAFSDYAYFDPASYDIDAPSAPGNAPRIIKNICSSDMNLDGKVNFADYFAFTWAFIWEFGETDCIREVG